MSTHDSVMSEKDNPNNLLIVGAILLAIAFFLSIIIGVIQFYGFAIREQLDVQLYAPESIERRQLDVAVQSKLKGYQWVNKADGVVRIPLDRATELTLRDWTNRAAGIVGSGGAAIVPADETDAPSEGDGAVEPTQEETQ